MLATQPGYFMSLPPLAEAIRPLAVSHPSAGATLTAKPLWYSAVQADLTLRERVDQSVECSRSCGQKGFSVMQEGSPQGSR